MSKVSFYLDTDLQTQIVDMGCARLSWPLVLYIRTTVYSGYQCGSPLSGTVLSLS